MINIAKRDRAYERDMDPDYIAAPHKAYNQYFRQYDRTPLLVVNAAEIDFVEHGSAFRTVARQVGTSHAPGTRHVRLHTS